MAHEAAMPVVLEPPATTTSFQMPYKSQSYAMAAPRARVRREQTIKVLALEAPAGRRNDSVASCGKLANGDFPKAFQVTRDVKRGPGDGQSPPAGAIGRPPCG